MAILASCFFKSGLLASNQNVTLQPNHSGMAALTPVCSGHASPVRERLAAHLNISVHNVLFPTCPTFAIQARVNLIVPLVLPLQATLTAFNPSNLATFSSVGPTRPTPTAQ